MKRMQLVYTSFFLAATLTASTSLKAFESAPSMVFVGSTYSGHEEITRQALNNISQKIKETDNNTAFFEFPDLKFDLLPEAKGLFGYKAKNMVIHGNFASDFPKQTNVLSLAQFWNNRGFADFENPSNQVIHFLRNYKNTVTLESAKATCLQGRENIKFITQEALKQWDLGEKSKALFLVGHATHTIQDSFSRAHTQRDGRANNYNLRNICFFGNIMFKKIDLRSRDPQKAVCYHSAPDSRDAIWNLDSGRQQQTQLEWPNEQSIQCDKMNGYPETDDQKKACLSGDARLARVATEKYLLIVFTQMMAEPALKKPIADLLAGLDTRLFDGPVGDAQLDQKMANGILRCDELSDSEIVGSEPIENNGSGG